METKEMKGFYKPNTNIKGLQLVIPDVDCCPCCGLSWMYHVNDERWLTDEMQERKFVTAESLQVVNQSSETTHCALFWNCTRCGYRHKHGVS